MNDITRPPQIKHSLPMRIAATLMALSAAGMVLVFVYEYGRFDGRQESTAPAVQYQGAPPKTHTAMVSLLPGQYTSIPNRTYRKVLIRSDYPLRIVTGNCHENYTVQFFCEGDPGDIFLTDTRRVPIFATPRANSITITVTEF